MKTCRPQPVEAVMRVHPSMLGLLGQSPPLPAFPRRAVPTRCAFCDDGGIVNSDSPRHPYVCANGHQNFKSPQVVSVAVVFFEGQVALVQRGRQPQMLKWSLPGGFMEWGDTTEGTARKEFGQEVFGVPVGQELGLTMDWRFIAERPGTDEMAHLFVWAAIWPPHVPYTFSEPTPHNPDEGLKNQDRPEVLEVKLFDPRLLGANQELAYPYQVRFIQDAAVFLAV